MNPEQEKIQTAVCPRCEGRAFDGMRACGECRGMGSGRFFGPSFLYWGKRIDSFSISLSNLKRLVDGVLDFLLVLLMLAGLGMLVWHIQSFEPSEVLGIQFWIEPHYRFLAFWFGVICISFLYYRRVIAAGKRKMVRLKVYGENIEQQVPVADDQVWAQAVKLPHKSRIDISQAFARETLKAIDDAYLLARKLNHAQLMPVHLFGALLSTQKISVVFGRLGLQFDAFKDMYGRILGQVPTDEKDTVVPPSISGIFLDSYVDAYLNKQPWVDVTELFMAVIRADEKLQELLFDLEVDVQKADNVIAWIRVQDQLRQRYKSFASAARLKPKGSMNRAMTAVATPFLDRISQDLTSMARSGYIAPVVGREQEFESVFRVIEGGGKSVVLVGRHGVGKDAIIEGIAQRMVEEDVPEILQDKRLVSINVAQLVSGATASEAQERLLSALYEVGRAGNIVLVVPEAAGMVGISAGSGGESIDLSRVFATELARGYFFAIATATPEEYTGAIENTPLGQALIKVEVPEVGVNEAIRILEAKSGSIEYKNKVFFSYDAIDAAVTLSDRYMHERFLPEKAIEVAKEVATSTRNKKGENAVISKEDVAAVMSEKTHIPLEQLTEEESKKLLDLEGVMHQRVVGQEKAVEAVSAAMRRARAELREEERPIANFLFLGPTGVGKTELAKTLAESYFGNEDAMIRLDMSEYQDKAALYKLIGEPAGESAGGILSEAVRKKPFALLLLDELEKAHPDVLTVFLQVMDDGRLSDNTGRVIDFTNIILIATSNAGAQYIQEEIRKETPMEVIKEGLMTQELKKHYRPEFLNRFDDVIVFRPLRADEITEITWLMLKRVVKQMEEKGITFEVTDAAVDELARAGYDPIFGARPLRRVIQDRVENTVADALLAGKMGRRDKVTYDVGGELRVEKARRL